MSRRLPRPNKTYPLCGPTLCGGPHFLFPRRRRGNLFFQLAPECLFCGDTAAVASQTILHSTL